MSFYLYEDTQLKKYRLKQNLKVYRKDILQLHYNTTILQLHKTRVYAAFIFSSCSQILGPTRICYLKDFALSALTNRLLLENDEETDC